MGNRLAPVNHFGAPEPAAESMSDASAELLDIEKPDSDERPLTLAWKSDGAIKAGRFSLTPTGLIAEGVVSEHDWKKLYKTLRKVQAALQWAVGDWVLYGEFTWGKTYAQMAEITGLKEKTLRDYAYVARSVEMSIRIDKLTFAHHQVVAALPPNQQAQWLGWAAQENLTVAQLRAQIFPRPKLTKTERIHHALETWDKYLDEDESVRRYVAEQLRQKAAAIEQGR
jgi:hypothetical protein